jgi:hypothetical protein
MWVFDFGCNSGICEIAILYSPKREEAQKHLADLVGYRRSPKVYCIKKLADISLPDKDNQIFRYKGQRYYYYDGGDFMEEPYTWISTIWQFQIADNQESYKKFLEYKEKYPECFKIIKEDKVHCFFSKDYMEYQVKMLGFPLEESDEYDEFQTNVFKIKYLDGENDRWMV